MTRTKHSKRKEVERLTRKRTAENQSNGVVTVQGLEGLNMRQQKFCQEYIYDWNASRAYRVAYPNVTNGSAEVAGCNLLRNIKIKAFIELIQKDIAKQVGISRSKVAKEYMKLAFNSIADLHNTWMTRKQFETLTSNQKACIQEIQTRIAKKHDEETGEMYRIEELKIKLYDKKGALDSLTRFFGFAEPDKVAGVFLHQHNHQHVHELKTEELSKPAQELLLEITQKQLTDGLASN